MFKKALSLIILSLLLSSCTLGKSNAGLIVKSQPNGTVFLNDKEVGKTPYENKELQPGSYTVKVTSSSGEWTSNKIRILENTVYNINRELATNAANQAGENVSIEKGKGITVVTIPSQVEVSLDGQKQGNTPYLIPSVSPGEHEITLAKEGYSSRKIKIRARDVYKIVIEAQLKKDTEGATDAPAESASPSTSPSPSPSSSPSGSAKATATIKPTATPRTTPTASPKATSQAATGEKTITILDTPTTWLRVRDKAGIEGKEIAKVNSGETFEYKDQLGTGWTLIVLADGTEGYVASRYVKVNK